VQFVIGCYVYIEVEARIFATLNLVLWTCWATPSPDSADTVNYTLADNGCPTDPTFSDSYPSNNIHRFSFEMFEFSSGYKEPVSFCRVYT